MPFSPLQKVEWGVGWGEWERKFNKELQEL